MRRSLLLMGFLAIMLSAPQADAVQFLTKHVDGAQWFVCELQGSAGRVSVKYRGNSKYRVLTRGKGRTGFSGMVIASSHTEAARIACGEQ